MTDNPYAIPVPPTIGDADYPNVTVRIAPYKDGCEALVEVCGKTYLINEVSELYGQLWYLLDVMQGDVQCEHYEDAGIVDGYRFHRNKCENSVFELNEEFCTEHKKEVPSEHADNPPAS